MISLKGFVQCCWWLKLRHYALWKPLKIPVTVYICPRRVKILSYVVLGPLWTQKKKNRLSQTGSTSSPSVFSVVGMGTLLQAYAATGLNLPKKFMNRTNVVYLSTTAASHMQRQCTEFIKCHEITLLISNLLRRFAILGGPGADSWVKSASTSFWPNYLPPGLRGWSFACVLTFFSTFFRLFSRTFFSTFFSTFLGRPLTTTYLVSAVDYVDKAD